MGAPAGAGAGPAGFDRPGHCRAGDRRPAPGPRPVDPAGPGRPARLPARPGGVPAQALGVAAGPGGGPGRAGGTGQPGRCRRLPHRAVAGGEHRPADLPGHHPRQDRPAAPATAGTQCLGRGGVHPGYRAGPDPAGDRGHAAADPAGGSGAAAAGADRHRQPVAGAHRRAAGHRGDRGAVRDPDPAGPRQPARPHAAADGRRQPAPCHRCPGRGDNTHQPLPAHAADHQCQLWRADGGGAVVHRCSRCRAVGRAGHGDALCAVCRATGFGAVPADPGLRGEPGLGNGAVDTGLDRRAGAAEQLSARAVAVWRLHRAVDPVSDRGGHLLDRTVGADRADPVDPADRVPAGPRAACARVGLHRRAARDHPGAGLAAAAVPAAAGRGCRGSHGHGQPVHRRGHRRGAQRCGPGGGCRHRLL